MKHGSLFSGIGGFDLAAEWMGWQNIFHCEWNKFGQQVLKYYFPKSISYEDITKTDFYIHRGEIDILTGGFPCQPYSSAGKRLGKEDDRHLWPEMLRAIREIQPRWVVGENVRGLTNWKGGLVFDEVQSALETQGYEVTPFLLPACAVNAPHRRDRIWFVAYSNNNDWRSSKSNINEKRQHIFSESSRLSKIENASNTDGNGFNECNGTNEINTSEGRINAFGDTFESNGNGDVTDTNYERFKQHNFTAISNKEERFYNKKNFGSGYKYWQNFPTQSPICTGDDGISNRLDRITFPKWRNESIKAAGNAIVPQVVFQIFKAIQEYEIISNTINTTP